jgi:hypothetical protein
VKSTDGKVGCVINRVTGKKVVLTDGNEQLAVVCVGLTGAAGPLATPPARTADGHAVKIQWTTSKPLGRIDVQGFDTATYAAPAKVRGADDEVVIHAKVTVVGTHETVDAVRTIHLVNRHLRLQINAHLATHCGSGGATIGAGFDLTCGQSIDLDIGDDFAIKGSNPRSCGQGSWSELKSCVPQLQVAIPQVPWSLDGVDGQLDPETALLTLGVKGKRVGYPDVIAPTKTERAHANPLVPRPATISADDGTRRTYGSMTTTAIAGGETTFLLNGR